MRRYLRHWRTRRDDDFWAWEHVQDAVKRTPRRGWALILALLKAAPSDDALMYIAAGPFENLFRYHGMLMVPTIAAEAVRNGRVRQALSGVWMNEEWPCYGWWVERMREYGYLRDETTPVVH